VLTIFGAHVRGGELVWSGGMVEILESLGFTIGSARAALARLVNRELLARTRDGRRAFYSATARADALLSQGDRRIFSFGRTQPRVQPWTVLWHAIPESQRVARSRFASQLRFLGFGSVQDATWIAARDREQEVLMLVRQLGIEQYASVMVGRTSAQLGTAALVAEAWNLTETGERYQQFLGDFGELRTARARRRLTDAEAFRSRTLMLHRFRGFPFIDPELPPEVDTVGALRAEVVACFDEVYAGLEESATRYFWGVVRPDDVL
jgi:phenylacetic acid degradation operon negative regulatory protein